MNADIMIRSGRALLVIAGFFAAALAAAASPALADQAAPGVHAEGALESTTRGKRLQGGFEIATLEDGRRVLRFDEEFRASRGPDLKIFLSPLDVSTVTGDTAVDGSVLIGELSATRGEQEYEIPADVDLSAFGSVLVHCERFAVLWGGADL